MHVSLDIYKKSAEAYPKLSFATAHNKSLYNYIIDILSNDNNYILKAIMQATVNTIKMTGTFHRIYFLELSIGLH